MRNYLALFSAVVLAATCFAAPAPLPVSPAKIKQKTPVAALTPTEEVRKVLTNGRKLLLWFGSPYEAAFTPEGYYWIDGGHGNLWVGRWKLEANGDKTRLLLYEWPIYLDPKAVYAGFPDVDRDEPFNTHTFDDVFVAAEVIASEGQRLVLAPFPRGGI